MSNLAVNVAVIHEGKILLTQREDFETWILPSGGVEAGLSRQAFYLQMVDHAEMKESVEIGMSDL
jgi:ADP-ribose pyrophosphatase YjhB (NUDIX family)